LSRQLIWRAAFVLAALTSLTACEEPAFVERVVVVNETDYPANVAVRGGEGGWLGLTTVPPDQDREVGKVIDQGPSWTFRFSYGSRSPVDVTVSKQELVDADWHVRVPVELEDRLESEGVPPPS
jgi:hypothetical protein